MATASDTLSRALRARHASFVNFRDRTWLRDFVDLAAAQVVTSILRFVALAWAARHLGPSSFALVAVAAVVNGYFVAGALSGLDTLGARDIAISPSAPSFVADTTALRLKVASAVVVTTVPLVWLTGLGTDSAAAISVLVLTLFPLALDPRWALIGLRRTRPVAVSELFSAVMNLTIVLIFVRKPGDFIFVPVAQLASDVVRSLLLRRVLRRIGVRKSPRLEALNFRTLRDALPLSGAQLIRSAVVTLDVVIVGATRPRTEAGQYAVASRLFVVGLVFLGLYYQVLLPRLVLAFDAGPGEESRLLAIGKTRVIRAVMPMVAVASLASPFAIPAFLGPDYRVAGRLFGVLVWGLACVAATGLYNQVLVVHRQEIYVTIIVTIALVVDIIGILILLPMMGIIGAPIAAVASESIGLLLTVGAARRVISLDSQRGSRGAFTSSRKAP